ncbi:ricin-type beta-trefoil lectin domain protein [Methylobacterium soli]|uniref:Ricin-type beta-trefoil lectin domain protein n=1 Tax=Methylobacterium soli TaxID=553447 RepID=A0A6L3SPU3_9HYPH|nr:ricin-type beta-trefoil lectin domain protein [Methylobacterium soli]GJE43846.1 hypothetical protein AEGHOMDF_3025 [Methylobacterium soli]
MKSSWNLCIIAASLTCMTTARSDADTGVFRSLSGKGDLCITVPDKPDLDRRFVTLETCSESHRQKFLYVGNLGRIRFNNLCLHAFDAATEGAKIGLRVCRQSWRQAWAVTDCPPNTICPLAVSDKDPILVNWQRRLCMRPVNVGAAGSRLTLQKCNSPTSDLDRWRGPGFPQPAIPVVREPPPPPVPVAKSYRLLWKGWSCITDKFLQCCRGETDFVVRTGSKLCKYQVTNNSLNPPDAYTEVQEIDGGIHVSRTVCGQISGKRAWFDSDVDITTTDPTMSAGERNALGCTTITPPSGVDVKYGSFCVRSGLPNGWAPTSRHHNSSCRRQGDEPYEQNEWWAVYLPPLPSGYPLQVCASWGVPAGWKDLGVFSTGACEKSTIGPPYNDTRRIEKL